MGLYLQLEYPLRMAVVTGKSGIGGCKEEALKKKKKNLTPSNMTTSGQLLPSTL